LNIYLVNCNTICLRIGNRRRRREAEAEAEVEEEEVVETVEVAEEEEEALHVLEITSARTLLHLETKPRATLTTLTPLIPKLARELRRITVKVGKAVARGEAR
jgi:hypothetical protein